jgi:hypothetical protein
MLLVEITLDHVELISILPLACLLLNMFRKDGWYKTTNTIQLNFCEVNFFFELKIQIAQ